MIPSGWISNSSSSWFRQPSLRLEFDCRWSIGSGMVQWDRFGDWGGRESRCKCNFRLHPAGRANANISGPSIPINDWLIKASKEIIPQTDHQVSLSPCNNTNKSIGENDIQEFHREEEDREEEEGEEEEEIRINKEKRDRERERENKKKFKNKNQELINKWEAKRRDWAPTGRRPPLAPRRAAIGRHHA